MLHSVGFWDGVMTTVRQLLGRMRSASYQTRLVKLRALWLGSSSESRRPELPQMQTVSILVHVCNA